MRAAEEMRRAEEMRAADEGRAGEERRAAEEMRGAEERRAAKERRAAILSAWHSWRTSDREHRNLPGSQQNDHKIYEDIRNHWQRIANTSRTYLKLICSCPAVYNSKSNSKCDF